MVKGIAVLGSTGSIGCNTLSIVESFADLFHIVALSAGRNMKKLSEQVVRHRPELVSVETDECVEELHSELHARDVPLPRILVGEAGMVEAATHERACCVVSATVGAVGFVPTLAALEAGKRVALANKETLVMAGELMTRAAAKSGADLLPVDSEHNALHQCLRGQDRAEVRRLVLTASGGPFRTKNRRQMERASVADALNHPTWNMGAKVTVDSATMMNKGLEVIEAHWLFGFDAGAIDVVIHPESIVHSMIELIDGSWIAQMGPTDMRHAIQYALCYPERRPSPLPPLDLTRLSALHFEAPNAERFPALELAYRALRTGGTMPAAMSAANEEAVKAFLDERIRLTDIPEVVELVMNQHETRPVSGLSAVLEADGAARALAAGEVTRITQEADFAFQRGV